MEVGSEVSMVTQKLHHVETDLPMLSLSLWSSISFLSPHPNFFATSQGCTASHGVLPSPCWPQLSIPEKNINRDDPSDHHSSWFRDNVVSRGYPQCSHLLHLARLYQYIFLISALPRLLHHTRGLPGSLIDYSITISCSSTNNIDTVYVPVHCS